ncbi:MAG TPA: hypothetical protein PLL66_09400 [Bacteroidales bacterium]|nr:hypothetical protein [Bacteroidales bacterium]
MKTLGNLIYFSLIILLFVGCHKGDNYSGSLIVKMTYKNADSQKGTNEKSTLKPSSSKQEEYYTQFGDYITSITPSGSMIKFMNVRFINWEIGNTAATNGIDIIDSNGNMEWSNPARFADFTNNSTVYITPDLENFRISEEFVFNMFFFVAMYFYQEFDLPAQYADVPTLYNLYEIQFDTAYLTNSNCDIGGRRVGLKVQGDEKPFVKDRLFDSKPGSYVFGNTDSTYVIKTGLTAPSPQSIDDPMGQGGIIIRSNKYNEITIPETREGETLTMHATMSFDYNDLIQVYAGADNVPYTSDDIFVYAPKYWERLSVNMTLE